MSGKVKSLHGVYKALGRDAFLAAAKIYSDHVQKTVKATLSEMESRWFDTGHAITQADKMVRDFQNGYLTRESAEELLAQEKLQRQFEANMNAVLKDVHFVQELSSRTKCTWAYIILWIIIPEQPAPKFNINRKNR